MLLKLDVAIQLGERFSKLLWTHFVQNFGARETETGFEWGERRENFYGCQAIPTVRRRFGRRRAVGLRAILFSRSLNTRHEAKNLSPLHLSSPIVVMNS